MEFDIPVKIFECLPDISVYTHLINMIDMKQISENVTVNIIKEINIGKVVSALFIKYSV